MHMGMSNEELHSVAIHELGVAPSMHDALRAVISQCNTRSGGARPAHT